MDRIFRIFFLLTGFAPFLVMGQGTLPSRFYAHYTGNIGGIYQLVADLIRVNDSIYGNYYFSVSDYDQSSYYYYYGKTVPLCGKVIGNNIEMKDLSGTKYSKFVGLFSGLPKISGNWVSSDGNNNLPFQLQENYSKTSVGMLVWRLQDVQPLKKEKNSPTARIALTMLLPAESGNPLVSDSLKLIILRSFSEGGSEVNQPDTLLKRMKDRYFAFYHSYSLDQYKSEAPQEYMWEKRKRMSILCNEDGILTYSVDSYGYTGTSATSMHDFFTVDLSSGKLVTPADVFVQGYEDSLSVKLTEKIRKKFKIPEGTSLKEAGFFSDVIKPCDNFYLLKEGIGFYYSPYVIAGSDRGDIRILFGYDEIRTLLKKGSILSNVLRW